MLATTCPLRVIAEPPHEATAWSNGAFVRLERGDVPGAVADDTQAIAFMPSSGGLR